MFCLGGAVIDVIFGASELKSMSPEGFAVCHGLFDQRHGRSSGTWGRELDAVVGENCMDLIGNGCDQAQQKLP
jgi:hypothetical protein